MGPQGLAEIGEGIMQKSHYAAMQLAAIKGVQSPMFDGPYFREFVVNFDGTGKSVAEINTALLAQGIFGGKDLTRNILNWAIAHCFALPNCIDRRISIEWLPQ